MNETSFAPARRRRTGPVAMAAALLLLIPSGYALAETQVQILNLSDLSATPSNLPGELVLRDEVCVRVIEGGSYRVSVDGPGGGFALARTGGSENLPFSVVWDSQTGSTERRDDPGEIGTFASSSLGCATDAFSAAVEIHIARADLLAVPAGHYGGSLTIEIATP